MVVGNLARGNLAVVVRIKVLKDRLGVLGRGLAPVFGGGLVRGHGIAGSTFRNRWL